MQFSLPVPLALQNSSRRAILYMIFSAFCFAAVELAGNFYVRNITAPSIDLGSLRGPFAIYDGGLGAAIQSAFG